MSRGVFLVCILAIAGASATTFEKCASGPAPISLNVLGCQTPPCELPLEQDAIMDVTFTVPKYSATLTPKVRATVGLITVTYPLPVDKQDGCLALQNSYCPVDGSDVVTYRLEMPIEGFPKVSVNVEFSVLGDRDEVFQCFKVKCKVVDAVNGTAPYLTLA